MWTPPRDETELVPSEDQLRQGDIIKVAPESGTHTLGVIINADCDLAHSKLDGSIAYLPIYALREYIEYFWGPAEFLKARQTGYTCKLRDEFGLTDNEIRSVVARLEHEPAADIAERIRAALDRPAKILAPLSDCIEALQCLTTDKSIIEKMRWFADQSSSSKQRCRDDVSRSVRALSGGNSHLFLSSIVNMPGFGFVVRLRRIHSVPERRCFRSEITTLEAGTGCRIARLTWPYKYGLAQMFAQQFSRVGLPDQLTDLKPLALEGFFEEIGI